jgi:chorismate synthase
METGIAVGVTSNIEGDNTTILAGVKDGITRFNPQTRNHEYLTKFWTEKDGPEKPKL